MPRSAREVWALILFALLAWFGVMLATAGLAFIPDDLKLPLGVAGAVLLVALGRFWSRRFHHR